MKWTALFLTLFATSAAHALPIHSIPSTKVENENLHKAYVYAVAPQSTANWVYLGFAPRASDSSKVNIHISKTGFTLRVTLEMTEQDVAEYPMRLVQRADAIGQIMNQRALSITEPTLLSNYHAQIAQVYQRSQVDYKNGLAWLKKLFPKNVFEVSNQGTTKVIAHFVYPITTLASGPHLPASDTYTTYYIDERRSYHKDLITGREDHAFGGFPALWFTGQIGIHGPIRYSNAGERDRSGQPIVNLWEQDEFGGHGYQKNVAPKYRWDLVRTKQSQGCIRTESMEIRHILPATASEAKRVRISVQTEWDTVALPGKPSMLVNVDYYKIDPYQPSLSREQWFQRESPANLALLNQMVHFPYLNPASAEFFHPSMGPDTQGMTLLNQAQ